MATAADPPVTRKSPDPTDGAGLFDEGDVLRTLGRYAQTEAAARRTAACGPPRPLQAAADLREAAATPDLPPGVDGDTGVKGM